MIETTDRQTHFTIFMTAGHGDLKIEWDEANHAVISERIQALMDKGVTFFKLSQTGAFKKKPRSTVLSDTKDMAERKLLIKDPDIVHLIEGGLASIARFEGVSEIKTTGKATADEAASADTIAVGPKEGG